MVPFIFFQKTTPNQIAQIFTILLFYMKSASLANNHSSGMPKKSLKYSLFASISTTIDEPTCAKDSNE